MNDELKKAIKTRDDFLKKHPRLQKYQDEIDIIMEKIGDDTAARLEALAQLAEGNMIEFQVQLGLLNETIKNITKNIKKT